MNTVDYALSIQRILILVAGVVFFTLSLVLSLTNPQTNVEYFWFILILIWVFFSVIFALIGYWWFFSIKKEIISIKKVNMILLSGGIVSAGLVYLFNLYLTRGLTAWPLLITTIMVFIYLYIFKGVH